MHGVLTNSTLSILKLALSEAELARLRAACTYKDESVQYAIKRASSNPWTAKGIPALKEKLYVKLYEENDDRIDIPQGLRNVAPSHLEIEDQRRLPKFKEIPWLNKPDKVARYYQREAVDALKADSRGQTVMATGTGKSFTMAILLKETGLKTLIICPSSIIGKQLYKDFSNLFGKNRVGLYGAGKKEVKQITVGLYQSVTRNIELFSDFDMVICDENQTLGAASLVAITRHLAHVPYFYSLSATNWRADGKTPEIYAASGPVVYEFETKRAISEGFLAKPCFIVRQVSSAGKDYGLKQKNYTAHVVKNDRLTDQILADIEKASARGMSTLILVQEIEHGQKLADKLAIPFANGENDDSMKLIEQLNKGTIKTLIAGAQLTGVGVDTVRVDCLIMASFPGTEGLILQLLGRGLRRYPGKEKVLVLDYIPMGNKMLKRHGEFRCEIYSEYGPVKIIKDVVDADSLSL